MNSATSSLALKHPKPTFSSSIPPKKIKPIFRNRVKWRCLMPSDVTYINKYKPRMTSTVELKTLKFQEINGTRNLQKALIDNKRISSLIIEPFISFPNFAKLGHLLQVTNRLKKLTIHFMTTQDGGEGPASPIKLKDFLRLRRCKDLSSLKLSFDCDYKTKRAVLKTLSKQVQGLPELKALIIDISECYPQDEGDDENDHDDMNSPLLTFKYPRSLSFLCLRFQQADSIDTELLPRFASNIQRCHLLSNIDLNFRRLYYYMEISETQILRSLAEKSSSLKRFTLEKTVANGDFEQNKYYLESFQHLKTVENLDIALYWNLTKFSNQAPPAIFFAQLAALVNLKSLHLSMGCPCNHLCLLNILSHQSLSKLEHLNLNFTSFYSLKNQLLRDLALTLPSLCNLKNFELILPFVNSSDIRDEGIITLSSSFKHLSQLKKFSLDFKGVLINHKIIETLSNSLTHLSLTSLQILLWGQSKSPKSLFQRISARWRPRQKLTPLFSALYGFNSLENLSLNLAAFDISTNEFKHFSLSLKELKQLKSLSLALPQFDSGNNYEGLRRFLSSLRELQKLNSLNLNFKGTKLCNEEVELVAGNLQDLSQTIKDLELSFQNAENLRLDIYQDLGTGLQNLPSLKNLKLSLGIQEFFLYKAVFKLTKKLTILKGLESLTLEIGNIGGYEGAFEILQYMKNHQNLKNLTNLIVNGFKWS